MEKTQNPTMDNCLDEVARHDGKKPKITEDTEDLSRPNDLAAKSCDWKDEKVKKWKQAGSSLRKAIAKITKTKSRRKRHALKHSKASNVTGNPVAQNLSGDAKIPGFSDDPVGATSVNYSEPVDQMLCDSSNVDNTVDTRPKLQQNKSKSYNGIATSSERQLPSFAELKERIRRMTSNVSSPSKQEKLTGNITKKRTRILRRSKSSEGGDKDSDLDKSSESSSEDYLLRKPQKPNKTQRGKQKRKSIDNATFSSLNFTTTSELTTANKTSPTENSPDLVSDSLSSDGELKSSPSPSSTSKQSNKTFASNPNTKTNTNPPFPAFRTNTSLQETESFANLADIESEGEVLGSAEMSVSLLDLPCGEDRERTPTRDQEDSEGSVPTLCSDSSDHKVSPGASANSKPKPRTSWPFGSDDDSDSLDDLPDLSLHLPHSSSSDGDLSPVLRITRADMEALPDLLTESSSDSETDAAYADDEFECDCALCVFTRVHEGENSITGDHRDTNPTMEFDLDIESPVHDITAMLFNQDGRSSVLEMMFENVIMQMLSVYPDLLSDQAPPPVSSSQLNALETRPILDTDTDDEACCPICLCHFTVGEEAVVLPCTHLFHTLCIRAWLNKSGTCPVCRHVLSVFSPTI